METPPEPHPLDFDWRFSQATIDEIACRIPENEPLLAVGAPSIARHFIRSSRMVRLVDRQPFQGVANQKLTDIDENASLIEGFRTAFVDPPWYPEHVKTWVSWTARCVGIDGEIFASIWPENTRPAGEEEFRTIMAWLATWSDTSIADIVPRYNLPGFEERANRSSYTPELSFSPRKGRLLRVKPHGVPSVVPLNRGNEEWLRFVINDYQLALRLRLGDTALPKITKVPRSENWQWPYVSRRAPGRELIDIWSSKNEVAMCRGVEAIAAALKRVTRAKSNIEFEAAMSPIARLLDWEIPRPPYRRTFTWSHQQ